MRTFTYLDLLQVWAVLNRNKPHATATDFMRLLKDLADEELAEQEALQRSVQDESAMANEPEGDF